MSDSVESEWSNSFRPGRTSSFLPCKSECLPGDSSAATLRNSDAQADPSISQHVRGPQNVAVDRLVKLKQDLRGLDAESFWTQLMERLASLCNSQYAFVARKVRENDVAKDAEGRSPSLHGTAFYYNDGHQTVGMYRNRSFAGGNPQSHMDHGKACLIPENLGSFISFDQDKLPFAAEGYLAVPLFSETKCAAYLGLMWSGPGLQKRTLSWQFLEMILHSLEDLIVKRIADEAGDAKFDRPTREAHAVSVSQKIVDETHINLVQGHVDFSSHALKPYARSLSHELRTPMQGIVGMLDVMHATVREAMLGKPPPTTGGVFQALKESIEMVQDSARRAVEAADNVVHAYDLNMQVPKTPQFERENDCFGGPVQSPVNAPETRPNIFIEGSNITVNPYKRRRSNPIDNNAGPASKQKVPRVLGPKGLSPRSEEVKNAVHESDKIIQATPAHQIEAVMASMVDSRPSLAARRSASHLMLEGINLNNRGPAVRSTKLRDLLRLVINESLHVGGRPDFAVTNATELGERIEVRSRSSGGEVFSKTIDWTVDAALPETLYVDDRDLAKLISCVFLNAVKFTNSGAITVHAKVGRKANDIMISVQDTGSGIPEAFLPKLFKPFARQDASTTRSKDGLGLGLLVAKGLARKMGGDLICVRSSTSGPDRGSEFEVRIPIYQSEPSARQFTPVTKLLTPPQLCDPSRLSSGSSSTFIPPIPPSSLPAQPIQQPSPSLTDESSHATTPARSVPAAKSSQGPISGGAYDSKLGEKHPLTVLVAEDNKINRRVLVNMLKRLGYKDVYEACNGKEAVRIMQNIIASQGPAETPESDQPQVLKGVDVAGNHAVSDSSGNPKKLKPVDVILMDLWMPEMDGYQATSKIFQLVDEYHGRFAGNPQPGRSASGSPPSSPTVLAVSADVTDEALARASKVGMKGYMTKPYKLTDLERLIKGFCSNPPPPFGQSTNS
ncbi:uncharacterized protein LDX57_006400 [Aspergillus melleus]|uniref:uncharacterized protein n=1 Tax=Aspergillus melleus TaxID=138277 RepID=UPI001E8EEB88|nr:uncharacterized protein LDX57_006400 [Aspergillus melleus]KAH8428712.1 hypothetical protein LDX57_006400 [Aspergillus melleus]